MSTEKTRPTVDEIYGLLKNTELPTVLVEGKDDIIFYRAVEQELRDLDVDMLPAGNKDAVLKLRDKILENPISAPIIFIVDKDLWVYPQSKQPTDIEDVITTSGYSIENDLFADGELENFLDPVEVDRFKSELIRFTRWYALSVQRNLADGESTFRTHPSKVLDDENFYNDEIALRENEIYPEWLFDQIAANYARFLRGKSLFGLILRQLSAKKRDVKFGGKQLMAIGATRKGTNFNKIRAAVKDALQRQIVTA